MKKAAGIIFYEDGYVLAGRGRWTKKWSGFGGKVEGTETNLRAAMREVLEELFNIHDREDIVSAVLKTVRPKVVYRADNYVLYELPLRALSESIIPVFWEFGVWIPAGLSGFISGFRGTREIDQIGAIPFEDLWRMPAVDAHFKEDLKAIGYGHP